MGFKEFLGLYQPAKAAPPPEAAPLRTDTLGRPITPPMTVEQQAFVVEQLAQFTPVKTIQAALKAQYGISLHAQSIGRYAFDPKWKPLVEKYRALYLAALVDVPIYHKRVRIERLEDQWQQMAEEQAATQEAKRTRRKEGREILSAAREETRELEDHSTNILAIQFNALDDAALMKKRDELIQSLTPKTITLQEERHDETPTI